MLAQASPSWFKSLLLLATVLPSPAGILAQDPAPPERLAIGETREGEITSDHPGWGESGRCRTYAFRADSAGPVTLDLESFDFNAYLEVRDASGATLAEDDNGGIVQQARLVFQAEAGTEYHVLAISKRGETGGFRLRLRPGEVSPPTGAEKTALQAEFYHRYPDRLQTPEEGDPGGLAQIAARNCGCYLLAGQFYSDLQRWNEARADLERALGLAVELQDPRLVYKSRALLASALASAGEPSAALEVLGAMAELPPPEMADFRTLALEARGKALLHLDRLEEAQAAFEQQLALAQESRSQPNQALAYEHLAETARRRGELSEARTLLEQAGMIWSKKQDANGTRRVLRQGAAVCEEAEDFAGVLEQWELLLASEATPRGRALALGGLAVARYRLGDLVESQRLYTQVLQTALEIGDEQLRLEALYGLATVLFDLGEHATAIRYLEELSGVAQVAEDQTEQARVWNSLGLNHARLSDWNEAEQCYRRSIEASIRAGDARIQATALLNWGGMLQEQAEASDTQDGLRDALERVDTALQVSREHGFTELEGASLANLADLQLKLDDPAAAAASARSAATILRSLGMELRALSATEVRAVAAIRTGDLESARDSLNAARERLSRARTGLLDVVQDAFVRSFYAGWSEISQELIRLQLEKPENDTDRKDHLIASGFEELGAWKSRALLEGVAENRRAARSEAAAELRRRRRALFATRDQLTRELADTGAQGSGSEGNAKVAARLQSLLAEEDALLARLAEISPEDAALDRPQGMTLEAVQDSILGPHDLLLDYADGTDTLGVYAVTREGARFLNLGDKAELEARAGEYARMIRDFESTRSARFLQAGRSLFLSLLAPALSWAGDGVQRVLIVPTSGLAALPFEALLLPADGSRTTPLAYVIDDFEVIYAPSTPVLGELERAERRPEPLPVLVLADPVYDPARADLPRLAGTRAEALQIAQAAFLRESGKPLEAGLMDRLATQRSLTLTLPGLELRLGSDASLARFAGDLSGFAILHLAAHGFVDREDARRSRIELSPDGAGSTALSLGRILDLQLDADLTILSGCETAQGRAVRGEGIQSLARAFLYAGSRSVIASLWKVGDESTSVIMEACYRNLLQQGLSPAAALRQAKLRCRRGDTGAPNASGFEHPRYWAPFICIGRPD